GSSTILNAGGAGFFAGFAGLAALADGVAGLASGWGACAATAADTANPSASANNRPRQPRASIVFSMIGLNARLRQGIIPKSNILFMTGLAILLKNASRICGSLFRNPV